jgi:hypothetical protein
MSKLKTGTKFVLISIVIAAITFFAVRAFDTRQMPPLELWHTHVPTELDVKAMDAGDWAGYLKAEDKILRTIRAEVTEKLPPEARTPSNRYYEGSLIYPARYAQDWNRSYVLEPSGSPVGAVVLLHGLTDSPYSLRHIARRYAANGFVVVAIRLPGHGTVPAGLSPSAKPGGGSIRRRRSIWSAFPTAARWPSSMPSTPSRTRNWRGPTV